MGTALVIKPSLMPDRVKDAAPNSQSSDSNPKRSRTMLEGFGRKDDINIVVGVGGKNR